MLDQARPQTHRHLPRARHHRHRHRAARAGQRGLQVRVGAHSWDLSGRRPVKRLDRATLLYRINATTIKVASPYGGGIYIEVPIGANAGVVNVTVTGAVRSPYFSAKSFHQTTAAEWDTEKTHPAPWADFQSDKFMMPGAAQVDLQHDRRASGPTDGRLGQGHGRHQRPDGLPAHPRQGNHVLPDRCHPALVRPRARLSGRQRHAPM